jgi:NAD(P)-dependent dehydrogenase (short-subunit alcohol dehydrogenase family)
MKGSAMNRTFEDKVALVTGGSSGIGRATALAFAHAGARVVIADIAEDGGEETIALIKGAGGAAIFVRTDVSKAADVAELIRAAVSTYGRLDYAFNNAGIDGDTVPTADGSEANWDHVLATNLKGVWLCMKHEIQHMLQQGHGAIVNTASVAGLVGFPGLAAYTASKHAIVGLTKTAALEYARAGIRINAVCPGAIRTPALARFIAQAPQIEAQVIAMEPVGRLGTPEEVAEAVVWLCSDGSSFVTGTAMTVDGGWLAQ